MLRIYQAANELERIKMLSAFNVVGCTSRKKLNQHSVLYSFHDGSYMQLNVSSGSADTWHKDWKGTKDDIHFGPNKGVPIRVNKFS